VLSQIDRNLFQTGHSRQRRTRILVGTLAGSLFLLGALTTLQAASESNGHFSAKPSVQGSSNRLLSGIGTSGIAAVALPYEVLANLPKIVPAQVGGVVDEPASKVAASAEVAAVPLEVAGAASKEAAMAVIDQWARAWRSKDVAAYLATYGEAFQPANGASRDNWAKQREQRIAGKRDIQVELRNFDVQLEAMDRVRVNFVQDYHADRFVELNTAKTMLLTLEREGWRIQSEESGR
jgi:hypothetical protein